MAELIEWGPATLLRTRDLTDDIRLFEIEPAAAFRAVAPGSHVSMLLPIGGGSDVRSYSIVSASDGVLRIAVKLLPDSRGGSAYLWSLTAGARLTVSRPRNHFPLGREAADYLLVAGGIGVTPIFGMALALVEAGLPVRVLYGVRSAADAALADELRAVLGERLVVAAGSPIDLDAEIAGLAPGGEMYVCGPIGMLEAAKRAWQASGRPVAKLRFETFGSSGRYATEAFRVSIPRLGVELEVPRTMSLLDALQGAGVKMIYFCRRGECGLCALPIVRVEGVVDHRDVFFTEAEKDENAKLCTCVSRAAGGVLTLDTGDRL
jgi:vanillate O-demethylase ferredoxin subunit